MGYRETNWSLPRADQLLIERQNVFDGTWTKAVTMGWMFVPLSEYHGGGPAATIEPLDAHLDHYEARFANLLGAGVQACWRGPRLYDTPRVRDAVRTWTTWFRTNRPILEADVLHGRRPDGRDIDWLLHVAPGLPTPAMLVVHNPLAQDAERTLLLDLSLAGIERTVTADFGDAQRALPVDGRGRVSVTITVPARSHRFVAFRR